jgi:hypothetical protein
VNAIFPWADTTAGSVDVTIKRMMNREEWLEVCFESEHIAASLD